jgi:hypothetical protein
MQFFIDTVTNAIHAFEDNVVVKEAGGVYSFAAPDGSVLNAPATLRPYTPPAPTNEQLLAQVQDKQLAALYAAYQQAVQQPVSYTSGGGVTKTYQADPDSVANLTRMLLAFGATQAVPAGFYWVADDNTKVPFTYTDLQGLAQAIGTQSEAAFQHLQALKDQVRAATSAAAVQAITW